MFTNTLLSPIFSDVTLIVQKRYTISDGSAAPIFTAEEYVKQVTGKNS
jgi:hypothetical protein